MSDARPATLSARPSWRAPGPAPGRALLAALVALFAVLLFRLDQPPVSVTLSLRTTATGFGEVFHADGGPHAQARSVRFATRPDGAWHEYDIALPSTTAISRIRIDPGRSPGDIGIRAMVVRDGGRTIALDGRQLRRALGATHHLRVAPDGGDVLRAVSQGTDPYLDVALPRPVGGGTARRVLRCLLFGAAAFLGWLLLEAAWSRIAARPPAMAGPRRLLDRACTALSDERVLVVDRKMLLAFLALAVLAVAYVALGLNQSSLGAWERMYPAAPIEQAIDLGTAKRIRSDEWNVQAPWVLNQVRNGAPLHNPSVGAAYSPLLASLPVRGAIDLPHLKFAGFGFLGIERGLSWWWAYKTFALLGSFLWLCLVLTRGNLAVSLFGTAWIHASSFTQWWFSSNLPEIMSAFALGVVGAVYALFARRRAAIVAGCALVAYAAANLVLNLYPPFIIPLGYLGVALVAGCWLRAHGATLVRHDLRFRSLAALAAVVAIGCYVVAFASLASTTIDTMLQTVYPGRRFAGSGGVPFGKAAYGYFEVFRLGEIAFPRFGATNASEASSFVLLLPLVLLAIPLRSLLRRDGALLAAIGCACTIAALWILFDLPGPLERILQAGGWSMVTPKRAVLALGVGSILGCVVLLAGLQRGALEARSVAARRMAVVAVLAGVAAFAWGLHQVEPTFFTLPVLLAGGIATSLLASGLLLGRLAPAVAGLAMFALPAMAVNPLVSGISAITAKPVLALAARHGGPGTRWAVIGDPAFAQGLKAHGLSVFAGTRFLPERTTFEVLDPEHRYEKVWNRYATIGLNSDPALQLPKFIGIRGDQFAIALDVCAGRLQALGVSHLAYTVPVPAADLECLVALPSDPASGVRLFRLR